MPFFANPSDKKCGLWPNLKQTVSISPVEPRVSATHAGTSAHLGSLTQPEPGAPTMTRPLALESVAKITNQLALEPVAKVTRQLTDVLTEPATPRGPVIIKGALKRCARMSPVPFLARPQTRHPVTSLTVIGLVLLMMVLTFFTTTPLGHDVASDFQPWQLSSVLLQDWYPGTDNFIAQAIAIYHQQYDGYDPFSYNSNQVGTLARFSRYWPLGQCTYWANARYHDLTGYWIPWNGNAYEWVASAESTPGWHVSHRPHLHAIMVLMPGVQGASGYGHVAIVEGFNGDGSVRTSNMNWYGNGGGWDRVSGADFAPGPGVYFLWHS